MGASIWDHSPMFIITNATHNNIDDSAIAIVKNANVEDGGVWVWMGFFEGADAIPVTPGMTLKQWILWDRDDHTRTDLEVIRVNVKSITVRATDTGRTHKIPVEA